MQLGITLQIGNRGEPVLFSRTIFTSAGLVSRVRGNYIFEIKMSNRACSTDLFNVVTVGNLSLTNRIAMAPLTRSRMGSGGVPTALHATYYSQRATAGLIISEATNISLQEGVMPTPRVSGLMHRSQDGGW